MASANQEIAVVKEQLKGIRELVDRNHQDAQSGKAEMKAALAKVDESIAALKADLNERRGAERLATTIRTTFAGAIGAGAIKLLSWIGSAPIK